VRVSTLLGWGVLVGTLSWLIGCSGSRGDRNVVVYTSVDQVYAEPVLRAFEARSGVHVLPVYDVEASKTTGLVNRLIAEQSHPRADVFWNGEFAQTLVLAERGLLAPYRSPAAAGVPSLYSDPTGVWTGLGARIRVLLVNNRLLGSRPAPISIFDLLDSDWPAEQVGLARPLFGTTATHAAALYAALGPSRARDFFTRIQERGVRVVDGNSVVRDLVVGGEITWGLTDSDDACAAIRRSADVRVILPDQDELGTLVIPGTVAIVTGGPNPEQGRELVDYLLGREAEDRLTNSGFFQLSLRDLTLKPGCIPLAGQVRSMKVSLPEIRRSFPDCQQELRKIFLR
jgi:iron(III) transport system substrate-binding protein